MPAEMRPPASLCSRRRPRPPALSLALVPPPAPPAERLRTVANTLVQSNSFKYLVAGALAGVVSRTVVSPLEVVATVNMCSTTAGRPLLAELRSLFAAEGMRGLFKGNGANCLKVAPTKGIQFLAFEALKRFIYRMKEGSTGSTGSTTNINYNTKPLQPQERLAAGGIAGIIAATICYPLEVAKTLLTAHPEKYSGISRTICSIARSAGVRGLYRGLWPTVVAMFPYVGIEFMIYEHLKLVHTQRRDKDGTANIWLLVFIGALAGAVAQSVCHPLDVVRKRLQLQGIGGRAMEYGSMMDATMKIIRREGSGALYRGLVPMYVSVLPSAGVSYLVYESVKIHLGVRSFQ